MNLDSPQTRYALLRTALELFHKPPAELDEVQSLRLRQQVNSQLAIGKRLLDECDASRIAIPPHSLEQAFGSLRGQFDSEEAFDTTLAYNGLGREALREALRYELTLEAVLEKLLSEEAAVSDEEVEIYYLLHQQRFTLPETRSVCHILITLNEEYAENSYSRALARISALRDECRGDAARLKVLAPRHSECPSAMQEGMIGRVRPGQLYPQLDAALFAMQQGELSEVIESELGLHLLYCESIHPAQTLALAQVREQVRTLLEKKRRASILRRRLQG